MRLFRRILPPAIAAAGLVLILFGQPPGIIMVLFGLAFTLVDMVVPPSFPPRDHKGKD